MITTTWTRAKRVTLLQECQQSAHLYIEGLEHAGVYTTESVTCGKYDDKPTVTFLGTEHHCSSTISTKLYCFPGTEHHCSTTISTKLYCFLGTLRTEHFAPL